MINKYIYIDIMDRYIIDEIWKIYIVRWKCEIVIIKIHIYWCERGYTEFISIFYKLSVCIVPYYWSGEFILHF